MDVSGKNVRVWANEHKKRDGGSWYDYNVSIGKKKQEGGYVNAYMKVKFTRDANAPEVIPNGSVMDFEGYLTVDDYVRDGEPIRRPMIMVTQVVFPELSVDVPDSYEQLDEEMPF